MLDVRVRSLQQDELGGASDGGGTGGRRQAPSKPARDSPLSIGGIYLATCKACGVDTEWSADAGPDPYCIACWDFPRRRASRERWAAMTPEEQAEMVARLSQARRERWAAMTPEEQAEIVDRLSQARRERWAAMTPEEQAEIVDRLSQASRGRLAGVRARGA